MRSSDDRVPETLGDDEAARDCGRHAALDGLLEWTLARRAQPRRRASRPWIAGAAAALLVGLAAALLLNRPSEPPVIARIEEGAELRAGFALESRGLRVVRYPDGTRLELSEGSLLRDLADPEGAKKLLLTRGTLRAKVPPQPPGRPLTVSCPQGEARVLGTLFRFSVSDAAARLEVEEGRVRLTRSQDRAAVDVAAGHAAVVRPGTELRSEPLEPPGSRVLLREDFSSPPAAGWTGEVLPAPAGGDGLALRARLLTPGERGAADWVHFLRLASPFRGDGIPTGPHTYLRFRYYAENFTARERFDLMLKRRDLTNHGALIERITPGAWTSVLIRVNDFVLLNDKSRPMAAGETIHQIILEAFSDRAPPPAGAALWIDDLLLFEAAGPLPEAGLEPNGWRKR